MRHIFRGLMCWVFIGMPTCIVIPALAAAGTQEQAITAAMQVASTSPNCKAIEPFYWEIGDHERSWVSGTEGGKAPDAHTLMPIASATKWIFAAYVVQKRNGQLTPGDIDALTMRSGYTSFKHNRCIRLLPARRDAQTVAECFHTGDNANYTSSHQHQYFYNGGHFQHFAVDVLGLSTLNNAALADEIQRGLGVPVHLAFGSPQLAGGMRMSAAEYAKFLRALLTGELQLGTMLGAHAVCTQPASCSQAGYTPVPKDRQWQYALGHWVENDPNTGDGAFSSAGAFGFYPWIDAQRRYYGLIARDKKRKGAAPDSVECGRRIRQAFLQTASVR